MKIELDQSEKELLRKAVTHVLAASYKTKQEDVTDLFVNVALAGIFKQLETGDKTTYHLFLNILSGYCLATGLDVVVYRLSDSEIYLAILDEFKLPPSEEGGEEDSDKEDDKPVVH